jgi:hypothetical protein
LRRSSHDRVRLSTLRRDSPNVALAVIRA